MSSQSVPLRTAGRNISFWDMPFTDQWKYNSKWLNFVVPEWLKTLGEKNKLLQKFSKIFTMDAKKIDPSCKEGYNTIRCEHMWRNLVNINILHQCPLVPSYWRFYVEVYISFFKKKLTDLQSGLPPPSPSTLRQQWDLPSNRLSLVAGRRGSHN